jgi:hypothetical protein
MKFRSRLPTEGDADDEVPPLTASRWIAYLLVSAALTILVGAVTPLSTAGILARILVPD